jgi:signal peptidase I
MLLVTADRMEQTAKPKEENFFKEILKASLIALIIVVPIRVYIAQPFIVQGASMDPTFETGNYLIIDQVSYRFNSPERGDVVVFKYPEDPSKFFIKRIIGLPGETIAANSGDITVFNEMYPKGRVLSEPYLDSSRLSDDAFVSSLTTDEYFVMGDNRRASSDSRFWGPLKKELIVGQAFLRIFPITNIGVLPGDYSGVY